MHIRLAIKILSFKLGHMIKRLIKLRGRCTNVTLYFDMLQGGWFKENNKYLGLLFYKVKQPFTTSVIFILVLTPREINYNVFLLLWTIYRTYFSFVALVIGNVNLVLTLC